MRNCHCHKNELKRVLLLVQYLFSTIFHHTATKINQFDNLNKIIKYTKVKVKINK